MTDLLFLPEQAQHEQPRSSVLKHICGPHEHNRKYSIRYQQALMQHLRHH